MSKPDPARRRPRGRLSDEFVRVIAQSLSDLPAMRPDVPRVIAVDAEYRLRELIQLAKSFMVHSKRTGLAVEDVATALRRRSAEPVFALGVGGPGRKVADVEGVYMRTDKLVRLDDLITRELPGGGGGVTVKAGWVALDGEQVVGENGRSGGRAKRLSEGYVHYHLFSSRYFLSDDRRTDMVIKCNV